MPKFRWKKKIDGSSVVKALILLEHLNMAIACSRPQTANPNLKRLEETGSENYRG